MPRVGPNLQFVFYFELFNYFSWKLTCFFLSLVRAYKRKSNIHTFCKDYHKSIDTLNVGLKYAPEDQEMKDGILEAKQLIAQANADPELRELRRQRAMADPDIQKIFKNPMVERLLQNFSPGGDQQQALKYVYSSLP